MPDPKQGLVDDLDSMLQSKISFEDSKDDTALNKHFETDKLMDGGKSVTGVLPVHKTLSSSVAIPSDLRSSGVHNRRHNLIKAARE